jgi:hypothetical protein
MTTKAKSEKTTAKKTGDDLRKPQQRILQTLAKSNEPLSRAEIAEKAKMDPAMTNLLGSPDPKIRAKNDKAHFKSLTTLGYVKLIDRDGPATYSITPAGGKALAAAK